MKKINLINGNNIEILPTLKENSIDSCLTDPPYEINFMKEWDSTKIAFNPNLWKEILRVLKPGSHLLAFGGTRTYHRMTVAIEDAGFEIRDCLMWVYGNGMVTALNVEKKLKDKEFEGQWTGLKPGYEPIILARKPLSETSIIKNIKKHGTGGLNIDDCRIKEQGRFPTNIMFNKESGKILDNQSGISKSTDKPRNNKEWGSKIGGNCYGKQGNYKANITHGYSDTGGASRFFYCPNTSKKEKNLGCEELINNHPTVKPIKLLTYLCKLITPKNGTIIDPFMGSGSTGIAAIQENFKFTGIELEKNYYKIAEKRINYTKKEMLKNIF